MTQTTLELRARLATARRQRDEAEARAGAAVQAGRGLSEELGATHLGLSLLRGPARAVAVGNLDAARTTLAQAEADSERLTRLVADLERQLAEAEAAQ